VADRGYVRVRGRNRVEASGDSLPGDPEVKRLYLGA
jgi:ABC-type branched-subunit amino acid transport system ATPase component